MGQIASSIREGVFIKNSVSVRLKNEDIVTILNEFVLLWIVGYGKQAEKWNKTFISNLRAKCSLISDKLLKSSIGLDCSKYVVSLHQVIGKISMLASLRVNLDGTEGVFSSFQAFMVGSSQKDFDSLGDSIVTDIRSVIDLIEKDQVTPLNGNHP